MSFSFQKSAGRLAALMVVTLFAVAVMLAGSMNWRNAATGAPAKAPSNEEATAALRAAVIVQTISRRKTEITDVYSGKIRPFERFMLAFEIAGRIETLGQTKKLQPVDEGSLVCKGDVLAQLDHELLEARVIEAQARRRQAQLNLKRVESLRRTAPGTVSANDRDERETELAVAEAQLKIAEKNLKNAVLVSPVDGVVSKRMINPGESINMHERCFEVVQVDRVLLVVGVPESKVQAIVARRNKSSTYAGAAPAKAYVRVLGEPILGDPHQTLEGEIYRISQTADDASGMFEVEILLANDQGTLRPGQIGVASIVIDEIDGYRIDAKSVLFQEDGAYLFFLEEGVGDHHWLFFNLGPGPEFTACRYSLARGDYVEQGSQLIVPNLPKQCRKIVVSGQHRLTDRRKVFIVEERTEAPTEEQAASTESSSPKNVRTADRKESTSRNETE